TILAVIMLVLAGVFSFLYQACLEDFERLAGPDRAGAQISFGIVLFLRWVCLAVVLCICVSKGGLAWPPSRAGQYFLVFVVHILLGFVSLFSATLKTLPNSLSDGMISAMGWVPYLLPAFQAIFALTVLFPGALEPGSIAPVRHGALGLMGAV